MDMITKLGAAAKEVADIQMRETLRQAFKLVKDMYHEASVVEPPDNWLLEHTQRLAQHMED